MRQGTCIHYNGIGIVGDSYREKCCDAGVNYFQTFDGSRAGIINRIPCIAYEVRPAHGKGTYIRPGEAIVRFERNHHGETVIPCDKFIEPTPEQVLADQVEDEASFNRVILGIKVASEWRVKPKPNEDRYEVLECPVCKGKLHLTQSALNGHVHGRCETKGCLSWLE